MMSKQEEYYLAICNIEKAVYEKENGHIKEVAHQMAVTMKNKGMIYIFGCGHSHILAEEAFYRAGGLVRVSPIFDSAIMLHEGAVKSSRMERLEEYGDWIFDRQTIKKNDLLFVFSTSGINGCPIEVAKRAKTSALAKVVAVTSLAYYKKEKSRHSSGKYLADYADFVIDTHVPHGDALVDYKEKKIAPGSTVICSLIWNMLISQLPEEGSEISFEPEYFLSGNVEGGFEKNEYYIDKYKNDIRYF